MKRLLALLAAVGMVVGAWYLREAWRGDGAAGDDDRDGGPPRLICASELADACKGLEGVAVTVEQPGVTYDRLVTEGGALDADGWLVSGPWPEMVETQRRIDLTISDPIARSDLALYVNDERKRVLDAACGALSWKCLGDNAGRPWVELGGPAGWGEVKVGHPGPDTTGGLLSAGAAAIGFFGIADISSAEFADGFDRWLGDLEKSVRSATRGFPDPARAIQTQPGSFSVVADLGHRFERDRRPSNPPVSAVVRLVGRAGRFDLRAIRTTLESQRWSTSGLDAPTGLPKPGVMIALRSLQEGAF